MVSHSFKKLREKLPQHIQEEASKKTEAMLFQLTLAEVREARKITQNELAKRLKIKSGRCI